MSSGSAIAAALLKGGQKLTGQVAKHQATMNDVHAVAITNHYAALVHQNEHAQHLEAVKQAHSIAGDRGFTVRTNNRTFEVGNAAKSKDGKSKPAKEESVSAAETSAPESVPESAPVASGNTMSDFNAKKKARGITGNPKAPKSGVAGNKEPEIWRLGTSGVKSRASNTGNAYTGSSANAKSMRNRIRNTANNPKIYTEGVDTTPEQIKANVSKAWAAKAAVRRWDSR